MNDAAPPAKPAGPNAASSKKPHPLTTRIRLWLLALLVLVLAIGGSAPYWLPWLQSLLPASSEQMPAQPVAARRTPAQQPPPQEAPTQEAPAQPTTAVRAATQQQERDALAALDARVTALENRPTPNTGAAITGIDTQLQQLGARLDALEAQLAQLRKNEAARSDSAQRVLIVALAELGNAIATSQPFDAELASVEALGQSRAGWAASLKPLEASAKSGIPSIAVLAQRFSSEVEPAILRAHEASPGPQTSVLDRMVAKLRSLVIIRRTDNAGISGDPVEAAVATAQAALGKGDLVGATAALQKLSGAPRDAAASWLKPAQMRLAAQDIVAKLTQQVSADLATATGGG
jgi:hypothetical protein